MSGYARRIKRLEVIDGDKRDADYWFLQHLRALDGDQMARANIDAIRAAGGSPGYRGFQAMIDEALVRTREKDGETAAPLSESDLAEMGGA